MSYILLWLGPQGVEIYDSWNLSEADQQDTKKVWDAFSAYFEPKSNFRLSRYQLRNIKQEEKEPVDSFVRRLKTHSQKCKFPPEYVDDHLIDQFIVGVAHDSVRKTILDKDPSKVMLDDCIQYARTHEATDRQFHCFQGQDQHMVAGIRKLLSDSIHDSKLSLNLLCQDRDHAFSVVDQLTNATSVQRKNRNVIIVTKLDTGRMHVFRNNAQRTKAPNKNPLADRNRQFMNYTEKNLVTLNSTS